MKNNLPRLIIVDPSLQDVRGHHYALTRVITASAVNSGYEVIVFSSEMVNPGLELAGAKVKPVFSMTTYDYFKVSDSKDDISLKDRLRQYIISKIPDLFIEPLKKIRNRLKRLVYGADVLSKQTQPLKKGCLADELFDALLSENIVSQDQVLVHTSDAMMYRAILQLVQKPYSDGHPCYHLCTPYDTGIMPHSNKGLPVSRVVNYLRLMGQVDRDIFLYAENELLAKSLSGDWGVNVATLDIPMIKSAPADILGRDEQSVFRVVYLGAARDEKGFNLLPEVVEKVLELSVGGPDIEFVIQCSAQIVGYNQKIRGSIEQLESYPESYVRLISKQQSMDDYYEVLDSADVVLACYQQERYRVRGSGVATEAVAYGKNMVVTPGTYPEWLAGDAGISAADSKEIAVAIVTFAKNREKYLEKAKKRADWFADKTSPRKYVDKLLKNAAHAKNRIDSRWIVDEMKFSDSVSAQVLTEDGAGVEVLDVLGAENKYNTGLLRADVSDDGYTLFIKQGLPFNK